MTEPVSIERIREEWAKRIFAWVHSTGTDWNKVPETVRVGYRKRANQLLSTVGIPERECERCKGSGRDIFESHVVGGSYDIKCPACNGLGRLSPETVEQAIGEIR